MGITTNKLNDRQIILNKLLECDFWHKEELDKDRINYIKWLKEQVNINELKHEYMSHRINLDCFPDIQGKELNTLLTFRQVNSISRVFKCLNQNNLAEAYHALVEFIDNYQYTLLEPLNDYEKLLISLAVEQFEYIYGTRGA